MAFRFRHFSVEDDRSTMPVGTDSMLLGSWTDPGKALTILDIGTGCGVLALMMAQQSTAVVHGIDMDPASSSQAAENFKTSPWSHRLTAFCANAEHFQPPHPDGYDFIISNPPFFSGSLKSPSETRTLARHETGMSLRALSNAIGRLLSPGGSFSVVLPPPAFCGFLAMASENGFLPERILTVRSWQDKDPVRMLARFSKSAKNDAEKQELVIFDAPGRFTAGYLKLTAEFHYF